MRWRCFSGIFQCNGVFSCRICRFVHLTSVPRIQTGHSESHFFPSQAAPTTRKLPDSISSGSGIETAQAASGMWRARRLNLALLRNVRTWPAMPREKSTSGSNREGPKVPMRPERGGPPRSSDEAGNARGAKGAGRSPLNLGQLGYTGRSPKFQRKAAAFVRWHEPGMKSRGSSPESVRARGEIPWGLLGDDTAARLCLGSVIPTVHDKG